MISVVCVRLRVIFTHGFLSPQKSIFAFLWENKNERHLQTKKVDSETSTTTDDFHLPIFTHHFDRHAFLYTHKHPLKFTPFISPTYFHPRIFIHQFHPSFSTYLFSPTFFHPLSVFIHSRTLVKHFTYSQDHPNIPFVKFAHHLKKRQEEEETHKRFERDIRVSRPVPNP